VIEAAAARLRQLTSEYTSGELDFATYRQLRGELLDSLVPVSVSTDTGGVPPGPAASSASLALLPRGRKRIIRRAVWSVIALITVGALAWIGYERGLLSQTPWRPTFGGPLSEESDPETVATRRAVEGFLRDPDWSDARLLALHDAWLSLPERQRQIARQTSWHRELTDAIRLRIKEQRALASTDADPQISTPLLVLAQDFGVSHASVDDARTLHSASSEPRKTRADP
jgi:hypothetical protein